MTRAPAITVLIDGQCSLCRREAAFLRRLDAGRGALALQDITLPDFDPARHSLTYETVMTRIHGVLPDGRVVEGVEVFRRAYDAVGWGWLLGWTAWPGLRQLADGVYVLFARCRLWLRGGVACAARPSAAGAAGPAPEPPTSASARAL